MSSMDSRPGTSLRDILQQTLSGTYVIERELGGGGMSRVFVAEETQLGRTVVIKVIAPELAEGLSAERFAREVQLAARLQQANIVPVLSAGTAGALPYYTMPFVRGESLRHRLASGTPLSTSEATSVLRDVARALACAHADGIVHRDIKPDNILLSGGAAVVTDFGIAKAIGASRTEDAGVDVHTTGITQAGMSLGTPAYMAPEQALGDAGVDHRADLYAWGVVAWELLAGEHPFAGRTTMQALVAAHVTEVPPSLAARKPDLPPAVAAIVMQCLEKDPVRRPATARALLDALESAVTPTGRATATPARPSRRRLLTAIAALLVAAIATIAILRHRGNVATGAAAKSLAVLPFMSTGGDTANTYLAEGIADEVTNTLSQVPGLRLAGRSSSARLAGKGETSQQIGAALNVDAVLDGTVRRDGDRIRVTTELSSARDGAVIWHESYDRAASDIIAVQDEIARAIAGRLQVTLASAGRTSLAASGTSDPTAYDLYLRGMYFYRRRGTGGAGITEAIAALQQATARDSMFARAWAGLSNALTVSPSYVNTRDGDVLPRARDAAERAVHLDSTLSDAHLALGYVDAELFQWSAAEGELRRAIALDPGAAEPRYRLGYALLNEGREADAVPELQRAEAEDPLYFLPPIYLGWAEVNLGRGPEGLAEMRRGLALEPNAVTVLSILAVGYDRVGPADSALRYAHRVVEASAIPARIGVAAYVLARNGARAEAETIARQLEATPPNTWTRWTGLALVYTGLGDTARAISAMEHASAGDGDAYPLYGWRYGREIPLTPRLVAVLRRYNLDPARFALPEAARSP
ncbi:MAG TPA: protein kinase [Gemmatimonadales bacterium]|jgi:serine/threonine-protein kinase